MLKIITFKFIQDKRKMEEYYRRVLKREIHVGTVWEEFFRTFNRYVSAIKKVDANEIQNECQVENAYYIAKSKAKGECEKAI